MKEIRRLHVDFNIPHADDFNSDLNTLGTRDVYDPKKKGARQYGRTAAD